MIVNYTVECLCRIKISFLYLSMYCGQISAGKLHEFFLILNVHCIMIKPHNMLTRNRLNGNRLGSLTGTSGVWSCRQQNPRVADEFKISTAGKVPPISLESNKYPLMVTFPGENSDQK